MSIVTEIVKMELAEGITKEEFVAIVDGLEKGFHAKQPGFIDTELLFDEQNEQWLMVQHWQSKEELHAASKQMFHDSAAEPFVKSLDPKSVKMTIAPQIKVWGKINETV